MVDLKIKIGVISGAALLCAALAGVSLRQPLVLPPGQQVPTRAEATQDSPSSLDAPSGGWSFTLYSTPRPLPNVVFTNPAGEKIDLSAFHGKLVLLNIWATWCLPCIEELPEMINLAQRLEDDSVVFAALSIDQNPSVQVPKFIKRYSLHDLPVYYSSQTNVMRTLRISQIPTTFIINHHGQGVARLDGPFDWSDETMMTLINDLIDAPTG